MAERVVAKKRRTRTGEIRGQYPMGFMKELIEQFPLGLLTYLRSGEETHQGLVLTLQEALPRHLVMIVDGSRPSFPADLGTQVGDTFYGFTWGQQLIEGNLEMVTVDDRAVLASYLPKFKCGYLPEDGFFPQEGGYLVPIAGTKEIIIGHPLSHNYEEEGRILRQQGVEPIYLPELVEGLLVFKNIGQYLPEDAWLYQSHIDVLLTAFADVRPQRKREDPEVVIYIDQPLHQFLSERGMIDEVLEQAIPLNVSFTRRGACNIKFMDNGQERVALVPSVEALGPIAVDLKRLGYRIAELGDDQVDKGGGVKCRSLDIRWRGGQDFQVRATH